jgi:hypothetical protein
VGIGAGGKDGHVEGIEAEFGPKVHRLIIKLHHCRFASSIHPSYWLARSLLWHGTCYAGARAIGKMEPAALRATQPALRAKIISPTSHILCPTPHFRHILCPK